MPATVLSTLKNGVRTVSLNRPERLNAINDALVADFHAALVEANADPDTHCVILRGEGRAFCAGDDLKEFGQQTGDPDQTHVYIERIQDITRQIVFGGKIVVGAIHGWAAGGGFEWVLNCDLVIMAHTCRCFFPEIGLGVFVTGGASAILPRLVGMQQAKALILLGDKFTAPQALQMGIAWRVVPDDRLFDEAHAVAERIAALPARAAMSVKKVLNRAAHLDLETAMALESAATVEGFLDPDTAARVRSALK
jgi:enoyl-CoA hydratase/carnithine racemase